MALLKIFRGVAFLEGLSYIALLGLAVPIKYLMGDPSYVKMLGMPHGILFMAYIYLAFNLKDRQKWDASFFRKVLLAALLPFGTFWLDGKLKK